MSGGGEVEVESLLEPGSQELPELLRFGMQMTLPDDFDLVTWYGRGPHESYRDRKAGAAVGVYSGSVDNQYFDYSRPQETGNKTDVHNLEPQVYRYAFTLRLVGSGGSQ